MVVGHGGREGGKKVVMVKMMMLLMLVMKMERRWKKLRRSVAGVRWPARGLAKVASRIWSPRCLGGWWLVREKEGDCE